MRAHIEENPGAARTAAGAKSLDRCYNECFINPRMARQA
jgi:hypothetical protein